MNEYPWTMSMSERVRELRHERGLTQEDLAELSGVSLATIQRSERGQPVSADTIASLAAAFNIEATDLTCSPSGQEREPYLPLEPVRTGRELLALLRGCSRLDFDFEELVDLSRAELVEEVQRWCEARIGVQIPDAAVARVTLELEGSGILRRLADSRLTLSGATYEIAIHEVDDEFGSIPILLARWEQNCAVIRVGSEGKRVDRAYIIGQLGKWETPADERIVYPVSPDPNEPL